MDDTQFKIFMTVVTAGLATIGGIIRWGAVRITKALDDNTAVHADTARANVEHAKATATLSSKIDGVVNMLSMMLFEPSEALNAIKQKIKKGE